MRWFLTVIISYLLINNLCGQYIYFNQLTGMEGDSETEQVSNIEVVDDGYVVWGGGVNDEVGLFHFVRKYDFEGVQLDQHTLVYYPEEYLYSGIVSSFQFNMYTGEFVMMQGADIQNGVQGRLLLFDQSLDLISDQYYNIYSGFTYFFGFLIEPDGYVVLGEQGPLPNSRGTFIAKLDLDGNVIWNEILQPEVFQHIYRNVNIINVTDGYLLGGWGIAPNRFGLITLVNQNGEIIDTNELVDPTMPRSNGILFTKLQNGEILMSQSFGYQWVEEFGNPNVFWTKLRVSKLDETTLVPTSGVEYFYNFEYFRNGVNKMLSTPDGGAIILGGYYGYFFDYNSWMLKVDANGNEEWFKEYTYETCNDCENLLYDIELAPDGGYIAAGYFINWDLDPRSSTWLVKLDACGDLEWQGCSPLNVPERKGQSFAIYPNPSTGRFTVETSIQNRVRAWRMHDLSGRQVAQGVDNSNAAAMVIDQNLPAGMYILQLELAEGEVESYKIQVVK